MTDDTTCPTCGRDDFDDQRAVMVHHGIAHGGVPGDAGRRCADCPEPYSHVVTHRTLEGSKERRYCSDHRDLALRSPTAHAGPESALRADGSGGAFVALEGIDGAGTTTQVERAVAWLADHTDREVVRTAEPTDGPIGTHVRSILEGDADATPATLALLFAADRLEHLHRTVDPALERGAVVVADRYVLSSLAYQRVDTDATPEWLRVINQRARRPDLTLFLDAGPDVCADRLAADRDDVERFERRDVERFERRDTLAEVYDAYRDAIDEERAAGADVRLVDGTSHIDVVAADVRDHLRDVL